MRPIRDITLKLRLRAVERDPIADAAEREGVSLAAFVRRAAILAATAHAMPPATPAPTLKDEEPWDAHAANLRSGLRAVR
jgi:hypothetical protein